MLVKKEYDFDIFNDCWSGAEDRISSLTPDLAKKLADLLEDSEIWGDETPTETEVNDFIWFEDDTYAEWLGFDSASQLWEYCDAIDNGADEDELWTDGESFKTEEALIEEFEQYKSENPDWEEYYTDWEDWADDNGYEKFELD